MDETNLGLSQIQVGTIKIRPLRIIRTLLGLAVVAQSLLWPQPDTLTLGIKLGAGLLLIDITLLKAFRNK